MVHRKYILVDGSWYIKIPKIVTILHTSTTIPHNDIANELCLHIHWQQLIERKIKQVSRLCGRYKQLLEGAGDLPNSYE